MLQVRADLHIHTVLSPCADLEMTPEKIIRKAKDAGLGIVGISDHNSTLNAKVLREVGKSEGIYVLTGAEVTTREEVHCLAFFEKDEQLDRFQKFLEKNSLNIPNPDGHFGYQPVVDARENILQLIPYYLSPALKSGISEVRNVVKDLDGIFIPAHVTRPMNGLFSHLGFLPLDLEPDALGLTGDVQKDYVRDTYVSDDSITLIRNSDAHYLHQIGEKFSIFSLEEISFEEIKMALKQLNGRKVTCS